MAPGKRDRRFDRALACRLRSDGSAPDRATSPFREFLPAGAEPSERRWHASARSKLRSRLSGAIGFSLLSTKFRRFLALRGHVVLFPGAGPGEFERGSNFSNSIGLLSAQYSKQRAISASLSPG